MKLHYFFVLALLTAPQLGEAQNIRSARLIWSVSHLHDLNTPDTVTYQCTFETYGEGAIQWKQKGGAFVMTFQVTSVSGQWSDVAQPGQVTYGIMAEGEGGTLRFEKNASGTFIILTFDASGASPPVHHRYVVSQITPN